jgi:beta-glucanase (GH16 family)
MIFLAAHLLLASTPDYATDFKDEKAVLQQWTELTTCSHCDKRGGSECTQNEANATTFGPNGMTHTTRQISASTSSCHAGATSGHITFNEALLYGNFSVEASWFDGNGNMSTATGFLGLDADGNKASITMGFHGDGWPVAGEGQFKYQHGIYGDVKKSHNRDYTDTGAVSLKKFNTFGLLWTKQKVEWRFNGRVVRTFTDTTNIPSIPMKLRLHSRSGHNDEMGEGTSFQAHFRSCEIHPLSPAPAPGPSPTLPTPATPATQTCKEAKGILASDGVVCCAKECGACGESHCGALPGGDKNCCKAKIEKSGRDCKTDQAPCLVK